MRNLLNQVIRRAEANQKTAETTAASFFTVVSDIRGEIEKSKARLAAVRALPLPPDQAKAAASRWLDDQTGGAFSPSAFAAGGDAEPQLSGYVNEGATDAPRLARVALPGAFSLLAAAMRPALLEFMNAQIDQWYKGRNHADAVQKAAMAGEIDAEILALERQEEIATRAAERAGVTIARRGDARPEIVIASDDALAAAA
jgi:hypothetical protein